MTIEQLFEIANQNGIKIYDFPMLELRAVALSSGHIAIDRRKCASDTEYKCIIAHEIGHCETDSFYTIHTTVPTMELNERQANRFAAELLVPFSKLRHAIHERKILFAKTLAMMFDVTLWFIQMVLELYEQELASHACRRVTWINSICSTGRNYSNLIHAVETTGTS